MTSGAVIFDMDGVLVDSEVIVTRIEAEMLTALGAPLTAADIVRRFTGLSDATMARVLHDEFGVDLPDTFDSERRERTFAAFVAELRPTPGIDGVLSALTGRGVPVAVASSSAPDRIARSLELTDLAGYFDGHLYSASMVDNGKPAPDLFVHAAAQLGVDPTACVVVEDSRPGVLSGVAAGAHVIGYTAGGHCTAGHADVLRSAGAHRIAASAAELATALSP